MIMNMIIVVVMKMKLMLTLLVLLTKKMIMITFLRSGSWPASTLQQDSVFISRLTLTASQYSFR